MSTPTVQRYAIRRLNPVQGVLQVLAIDGARALSHDGRLWEIQVLADIPDHTWRSTDGAAGRQFFRYGSWHVTHGLRQVPANPLLDLGAMQAASDRLIDKLHMHLAELPFPLADDYECWLFDGDQRPLALVASTTDRSLIAHIRPTSWQASTPAEGGFVSASLQDSGLAPDDHDRELENLVRASAVATHWYHWDPNGQAAPCSPDAPTLEQADFPSLGLQAQWPEPWQTALAGDYLDWLAPALLTWDKLDTDTRAALEAAACRNALGVARHWPLYPAVIDEPALTRARVEARLRNSKDNR